MSPHRLPIAGIVFLGAAACFSQTQVQLLTPATGVVVLDNRLLRTQTGGRDWADITPPAFLGQRIDGVFFADSQSGWAVLSEPGLQLVSTADGGSLWSPVPFHAASGDDLRSYGGAASLHFVDPAHGWILLRRASSSNFNLGALFVTTDGGATWARLPDPPIGGRIRFASFTEGWLTGGPEGGQTFLTRDAGETWIPARQPLRPRPAAPRNLPGMDIVGFDFVTAVDGWLVAVSGQCESGKTNCVQQTHLYRTTDGGQTAEDITPRALPNRTPRRGPVLISTAEGFDKCSADTLANMQAWWHNSPYTDVNIYIGGSSRACSQANLTALWVNQILAMGWRLIPTWVGPQAPCNNFSHRINSDPAATDAQGAAEADAAADAAARLGLAPTVIYYDLEYYNNTNAACDAAVRSFINGWVRQSHVRGNVAGSYGSPYDLPGWAQVAYPPDAVWVAKWDQRDTVWDLSPLSNSLWANRNRLHQYIGDHNETWGGVTFNIDCDVEYGPVAVSVPLYLLTHGR